MQATISVCVSLQRSRVPKLAEQSLFFYALVLPPRFLCVFSFACDRAHGEMGMQLTCTDNNTAFPLKARGNTQGLGNRLGWYLTVAALADVLGRRAVYTSWPNVVRHSGARGGSRDYDFTEVDRILQWPPVLRFLNDSLAVDSFLKSPAGILQLPDGTHLRGTPIPHHPKPYINDYVPECAWEMLAAWPRRGFSRLPVCIPGRAAFLHAYRRAQAALRPKAALCNPPPKSYAVLHIRRGDKAAWARLDRKGSADREALANATALSTVIATALQPFASATGLPFLVLTDGGRTYQAWAEAQLEHAGLRNWRPSPGQPSCCSTAVHNRTECSHSAVTAALTDFLAIQGAAAVIVIAPRGVGKGPGAGLQESSFATVAALAGGAPHLTPVPYALGGKMASYQQRTNNGRPLRNVFFLEGLRAFVRSSQCLLSASTPARPRAACATARERG